MKPSHIQRGLRRSSHTRSIGSAPSLGRLGRMSGGSEGTAIDSLRARRNKEGRAAAIRWSIVFGVIALGVLGASFVVWVRPILARAKDTTERDRIANESRVRKLSKFESPSKEEAQDLVQKALAVRQPDQVTRWIRPGTATPQEVVDFFAAMTTVDGTIEGYNWLSNVDKNGLLLEGVQVVFKQPEKLRSRLAFLTPDAKGVWKMDFEAFARQVRPAWETILTQSTGSAVVRVYAGPDRYYNGPFTDEQMWAVYGMGSEDLDISLYGYCKRGSPQHSAMELMVSDDEKERALVRATLEIRKNEGADRRQFEITRVLAEDWVMGEEAFDSTLK